MLEQRCGSKEVPAILTELTVQKSHGERAGAIGSQDAVADCMSVPKMNTENGRNAGVFGKVSWIADELIGIRTLEESLSKKLKSRSAANNRVLLNGIRILNTRVELLDRALDEFSRTGRAA